MRLTLLSPARMSIQGPAVASWRQAHRRRQPGYQFTPQYKAKAWDGYLHPGYRYRPDSKTLWLGRGWLESLVEEAAPELKSNVGPAPTYDFYGFDLEALRDYQEESLRLIQKWKWLRIALATNAGKGAIIALTAAAAAKAGIRVVILCDEISVYQALEGELEIWAQGLVVSKVASGCRTVPKEAVTLAMVPTLVNRLKKEGWAQWLDGVGMVLADEADRAVAPRWQKTMRSMPNSYYRVGFSGSFGTTGDDVEEMVLEECLGRVHITVKNVELVKRKISARPIVELFPYTASLPSLTREEWQEMTGPERRLWAYEEGVVFNSDRHLRIQQLLHPDGQNAVVVNRVAHGEELSLVIPDSVFLYGDDSKEVRSAVLERFREGEFQHLIVTKILDRGTNLLGHAVGLVFASGEGSTRQTLQRIGRGLRRGDGKEFLFLRDLIDRGHRYFQKASRQRVELYNAEGFEVTIFREGAAPSACYQEAKETIPSGA